MIVDFPAPFAPISPTASPLWISKEIPLRTGLSFSYANVTSSKRIIAHLTAATPAKGIAHLTAAAPVKGIAHLTAAATAKGVAHLTTAAPMSCVRFIKRVRRNSAQQTAA